MHDYVSKVLPLHSRTAPGRVVAVVPELDPNAGGGGLTTFFAARWRVEGGEITREVRKLSLTPAGVWEFLRCGARRRSLTTLYLMNAKAVLEGLGWQQAVADGTIQLLHHDSWSAPAGADAPAHKRKGTVSLTPGAFFVDFALAGGQGKYKVVDLANFFPDLQLAGNSGLADLRIVVAAVRDWHELVAAEGLGRIRATIPAQALEGFRARFLPSRLYYRRTEYVCRAERDSYYGGRCECFRLGLINGPVYELDTVSCYLRLAQNASIPIAYAGYGLGHPKGDVYDLGHNPYSISDATVRTSEPCLPMRCGRRVIYPTGVWRGVYSGTELSALELRGGSVTNHQTWWYRSACIFKGWSEWALEMRRAEAIQGTPHTQAAVKRLGVALFGKLGQRGQIWQSTGVEIEDGPLTGGISLGAGDAAPTQFRVLNGAEQITRSRPCPRIGAPAAAGYVTALGRGLLQARIDLAGREHVYYVDTDCLFTDQTGYNALQAAGVVRAAEPGYLRLVDVHDWIVLHSPKHYLTPRRRVHSGQPPVLLSPAERRAALEEPVNFSAYYHGRVLADGRVVPFRVGLSSPGPVDLAADLAAGEA